MLIKIVTFMSQNPIFKGSGLIVLSVLALVFANWLKGKGKKPSFELWVFIGVAVYILVYGIYILIFRPNLWSPPY